MKECPAVKQLAAIQGLSKDLENTGWNIWNTNPKSPDLFSQHCFSKNLAAAKVDQIFNRVVQQLVSMRQKVGNATQNTRQTILLHMVSYPTMFGNCRPMHYADLDLLYRAREAVAVNCAHAVLYRNPYDVIYGKTVKSNINGGILEAIRLYSTMLSVMYRQISTFPDRTLACWGFFEGDASVWTSLQQIWLWNDKASFQEALNRTWQSKEPLSEELRAKWFPPSVQPAMETLLRQNAAVVALCQEQVRQYRPWWMAMET